MSATITGNIFGTGYSENSTNKFHFGKGITVNGNTVFGNNSVMSITNGQVTVNGKQINSHEFSGVTKITIETVDEDPEVIYAKTDNINLHVTGECTRANIRNGDLVINGPCNHAENRNGSITVTGNVTGNVESRNGSVNVKGYVSGNATSRNGSVYHNKRY